MIEENEDELLRSVAFQNAKSILLARQRAEEELIRTQEALRQSEERLKAALTAAGTGTFRWDIRQDTVRWDGNLDRMLGLRTDRSAVTLSGFTAAVHPQDRAAVRHAYEQCARDATDIDMEFRVVSRDAGVRWIHEKAKAFLDDNGLPLYVTGACADVTRRKNDEQAFRDNEARLRAIFNQAAVGIAVTSLDGTFIDMNRRFSNILGYSLEELRQLRFTEITHADDLPETTHAVRRLLDGVISEYALEKRYIRKDGSIVWGLSTVTVLKDALGQPQHLIGVLEDITDRKRAEAALLEERRVLELLNRTGQVLASSLDLRAVLQTVADAATELSAADFGAFCYNGTRGDGDAPPLYAVSGKPPGVFETLGDRCSNALFAPTLRGEAAIRADDIVNDPRYQDLEFDSGVAADTAAIRSYLAVPVRSRSGEVLGGVFLGHAQAAMFSERAERLVIGVAAQAGIAIDNARLYEAAQRDAEERRALLDSERAARTAAERMSEVKDEFLATLSHELRTPLNAIVGWAHLLRTGSRSEKDVQKGLDTIERNARMQTQLIEDLLDMSRITSGKLRLDIQPVQPVTFIEAAIDTVRPAADAKEIKIQTLLDPTAGPLSGDPARLQQVVWNLLSNAIKFTPKGGKVQVLLEQVNSHVEITVADTGMGVRSEVIPHLFERFRQADSSSTRQQGGLGLGLSIVKSLVELHGGSISVTSAGEGKGTTAMVQLPVLAANRRARDASRQHPKTPTRLAAPIVPTELSGLTILVVDDQNDARDLIRRILEDSGALVLTAASATEALSLVEAHAPHVLISDIGMPSTDGFELLKRVRALGADHGGRVPAIALTAFARSEDRTRALRAGFIVHVAKPVDPSELIATVASVAGRVASD
jgi:PAS domain S-box-containing protein